MAAQHEASQARSIRFASREFASQGPLGANDARRAAPAAASRQAHPPKTHRGLGGAETVEGLADILGGCARRVRVTLTAASGLRSTRVPEPEPISSCTRQKITFTARNYILINILINPCATQVSKVAVFCASTQAKRFGVFRSGIFDLLFLSPLSLSLIPGCSQFGLLQSIPYLTPESRIPRPSRRGAVPAGRFRGQNGIRGRHPARPQNPGLRLGS
jgi:hypothetical protein